MTTMFSMPVTVTNIEQLTPIIKGFTFERTDGSAFSPSSAGRAALVAARFTPTIFFHTLNLAPSYCHSDEAVSR